MGILRSHYYVKLKGAREKITWMEDVRSEKP